MNRSYNEHFIWPIYIEGFFIEAGALDGYFLSNTLWLEKVLGWTGLLVEPDEVNFNALKNNHRKAYIADACLSVEPYPQKSTFRKYTLPKIAVNHLYNGLHVSICFLHVLFNGSCVPQLLH